MSESRTSTHPRIKSLQVRNFQSIAEADISLGSFTVLVGPSNSGKSAVLRALRAVVRNVNSPSAVRVGKNVFTASVEFDDTTVSIERGKSQSTYRIIVPDGREEVYTKAGRTVPDDVQGMLALPLPDGTPDLVFSSQIDPPFLLAETGSVASKILGDLTNVSKLQEASREANRRRNEHSKLRAIRQTDAQECADKMQKEFGDLHAHSSRVKEARAALDSVAALARRRDALRAVLDQIEMLDSAEKSLRTRLAELPEPQDIEALAEQAGALIGTRHLLLDQISILQKCAVAEQQVETIRAESAAEMSRLDDEWDLTLRNAGTCPTCNQKIA